MSYSVLVQRRAQKQIARFPTTVQDRIESSLQALADNPRPPGCLKLQGEEGWRLRVGDYRILYEIDDGKRAVTVLRVAHRGDVYR